MSLEVIDISTHLLLMNTVKELATEFRDVHDELGLPMRYDHLAMVNKALEIVRVARVQAKAAGVMVEGGPK